MLNLEQLKALSNFFLDIAKGLMLTSIGFIITSTLKERFLLSTITGLMSVVLVIMALSFLRENKNV